MAGWFMRNSFGFAKDNADESRGTDALATNGMFYREGTKRRRDAKKALGMLINSDFKVRETNSISFLISSSLCFVTSSLRVESVSFGAKSPHQTRLKILSAALTRA